MRKYFQFVAWLVVTMLGACSGGTESKEAADTAMEDKPVVRLASRNFPRCRSDRGIYCHC